MGMQLYSKARANQERTRYSQEVVSEGTRRLRPIPIPTQARVSSEERLLIKRASGDWVFGSTYQMQSIRILVRA
jgi:hypothetical protein